MELARALEASSTSAAWHPSSSQPTKTTTVLDHHPCGLVLRRNGGVFRNKGAVYCSARHSTLDGAALLRRCGPMLRVRARGAAQRAAEVEVVDDDEEVPRLEEEGGGGEKEAINSDAEEFGIDEAGNLTAALPPEFIELMKDEGPSPNYLLVGFGLIVAYVARKSIWKEIKLWGKLAVASVRVAWKAVVLLFKQLIVWGGDPLEKVIIGLANFGLTTKIVFKLIADIAPPLPILYAVTLASIVLLVGESVSDTYSSSEFPSRNILDIAGLLGLGAFIGVLPVLITLLGLAAITVFLLFVRKVNPVAGMTPAAAVFAAVAQPIIRYPVLLSFVAFSLYRYWKLGYLSSGAVQKERTSEYPRILIAFLYLLGVSCATRFLFTTFDRVSTVITAVRIIIEARTGA